MSNVVKTESFVVPSVRAELNGELGLDLHEIAKSLDASFRHVKDRFEKLREEGEFVGCAAITAKQEIQEVTGHKYTREIESYVLTVDDAKFLVTQYGNKMGREYCKFLIARDKTLAKVQGQITNPLDAFRAILHSLEAQQGQLESVQKTQLQLVADSADSVLTTTEVAALQRAVKAKYTSIEPFNFKNRGLINRGIKERFGAGAAGDLKWKEIPRKNFKAAMEYVKNWKPYN